MRQDISQGFLSLDVKNHHSGRLNYLCDDIKILEIGRDSSESLQNISFAHQTFFNTFFLLKKFIVVLLPPHYKLSQMFNVLLYYRNLLQLKIYGHIFQVSDYLALQFNHYPTLKCLVQILGFLA